MCPSNEISPFKGPSNHLHGSLIMYYDCCPGGISEMAIKEYRLEDGNVAGSQPNL